MKIGILIKSEVLLGVEKAAASNVALNLYAYMGNERQKTLYYEFELVKSLDDVSFYDAGQRTMFIAQKDADPVQVANAAYFYGVDVKSIINDGLNFKEEVLNRLYKMLDGLGLTVELIEK